MNKLIGFLFILLAFSSFVYAGEYYDINISYDKGVYNYELLGISYHEKVNNLGFYYYKVYDINNQSVELGSFDFSGEVRVYYEDGTDDVFRKDHYSKVLSINTTKDLGNIKIYDDQLNNILDILIEKPLLLSEFKSVDEKDNGVYLLVLGVGIIFLIIIFSIVRLRKKIFLFLILFSVLTMGVDQGTMVPSMETVQEVSYEDVSFVTQGDLRVYTFDKKGGVLNVGDRSFENIVPMPEGHSKIIVDQMGKVVEANFKVSKEGYYTLGDVENFYVPSGSIVRYKDGVINLEAAKGSKLSQLPIALGDTTMKIKGDGVWFSDGLRLDNGELILNNGGFFFKELVVNGVHMSSEEDIPLFLDGISHGVDDSYVSLGKQNIFANIALDKGKYSLEFTKDSFFKGDVAFDLNNRGSFSLDFQDRVEDKPLVTYNLFKTYGSPEELIKISNGGTSISILGNKQVLTKKWGDELGEDFIFQSLKTNNYFEFEEGNLNFGAIKPVVKYLASSSMKKEFQDKFGVILNGDYNEDELKKLTYIWTESTIDLSSSINEVTVYDDPKLLATDCGNTGENTAGCAFDNQIYILRSKINSDVIDHEMAHGLQSVQMASSFEPIGLDALEQSFLRGDSQLSSLDIEKDWRLAAFPETDGYGYKEDFQKGLVEKSLLADDDVTWVDPNKALMSDGFVSPYSAKTWKEDNSEALRVVKNNPADYSLVVCKNSKYYDKRYENKLEVLFKYKYITKENVAKVYSFC